MNSAPQPTSRVSAKAAEFSALAPQYSPAGFTIPDGPGIMVGEETETDFYDGQPAPQSFNAPENPGPDLAELAPSAGDKRDPKDPFLTNDFAVLQPDFDPRKPLNAQTESDEEIPAVNTATLPAPTGMPVSVTNGPLATQASYPPAYPMPRHNPYPPNPYATGAYNQTRYPGSTNPGRR